MRVLAIIATLALTACGPDTKLPPLPPAADLCIYYNAYRYSAPAAAVESLDALAKHNANEAGYHEKCLLGDRSKSLGPR